MKPSADVARLADQMHALRAEAPPRTLPILIGDLCATRAGVPSTAQIGRDAMLSLFDQTPEYAAKLLPNGPNTSDDEMETAFLGWLGGMTHLQRYRVLEPFYRRVPVPLFYQDVAELVVNGFVTHILTTNVDTLLEQALDTVGFNAGREYDVQVLGSPGRKRSPIPDVPLIIKLYGDLGEEQLPIGPEEIDRVLDEHRSLLKVELATELIVVGHQLNRDQPRAIDEWLARGGGEMWWVHPEEPAQDLFAPIAASRVVTLLTGDEEGEPEAFFGQLDLRLIRLPAVEVLGDPKTSGGDDDFEQEFLKSRIEKTQLSKYSLEQNVLPGEVDVDYEAHLGYLINLATSYGGQLRELVVPDARGLLMRLVEEALQADIDQSTVEFLTQQATIVERELESPEPNQLLVTGAISAANSVAQGLGPLVSTALAGELRAAAATSAVGLS